MEFGNFFFGKKALKNASYLKEVQHFQIFNRIFHTIHVLFLTLQLPVNSENFNEASKKGIWQLFLFEK